MITYTVGFLFDKETENVILTKRERPKSFKDAWAGIGGKLATCDCTDLASCQAQKFYEDTGVITSSKNWIQFLHLHWKGSCPGEIYFFKKFVDYEILEQCENINEERETRIWNVHKFMTGDAKAVNNLKWVLCAALTDRGSYYSVEAFW